MPVKYRNKGKPSRQTKFKPIFKTLGAIFLALFLLGGGVWFWPKQLLFPVKDFETVTFMDGSTVRRDQLGFWSVKSSNVINAYHALGFVFAMDRLFQFDLARRGSAGRLSEVFGEKTVALDTFNRSFGYEALAEKDSGPDGWLSQPENEPLRLELESFIRGVNEYVAMIESQFWYWPPEYRILRVKPTSFSVKDAFLAMSSMQLYFNSARKSDLSNSHILSKVPNMADLFFGVSNTINISAESYLSSPLPKELEQFSDSSRSLNQESLNSKFLATIGWRSMTLGVNPQDYFPVAEATTQSPGSNAWMCSGSRMKEGFSTLANDPHLALGLPSFLNFAHIETPNFEVMGAFIPLSPYPVIGMSNNGAWGMTFSEIDQADFYEGHINGDKLETATKVMFGEIWVPLEKRRELIKVSGSDDIAVVYAKTEHAVVLNDDTFKQIARDGKILLSSDVSLFRGNRHLQSVRSLALSTSKEDFRSTIKHNRAPPQNVFWVGATGEIAWGVAGWVAQRNWNFKQVLSTYFPNFTDAALDQFSKNHPGISNIPGSLVMPYAPEFIWSKTSTAANFAYSDQFKGNCMGNANEQLTSDIEGAPSIASTNWALPLRSKRISELLKSTSKFDEKMFMRFQTDVKDNFADEILPKIFDLSPTNLDANGREVLDRLKSWDRMSSVDSKGQLAFELLMFNWRAKVMQSVKELSEENLEMHGKHNSKVILGWVSMLLESKKTGDSKSSHVSLIESSLEKSFNELKEYYSSNGFNWQHSNWGEFHTFGPEHTLASIPVIGHWFKYPSLPISGSTHSLAVQSYNKTYATKDFRSKSGAGLRFIAMPEKGIAWAMFPTGASGVPGAKGFFRNQNDYISGSYYELKLKSAGIKAGQSVLPSK